MSIEYEAKYLNVDKDEVRARLKNAGAVLVLPEFKQRRWVLDLPHAGGYDEWLRVRDEGNKITLSYKSSGGDALGDQREIQVSVSDFDGTVELLKTIGCRAKSYQENFREMWMLDDTEIVIDTWPFMEPFVEVEAPSESRLQAASLAAGFDWSAASFFPTNKIFQLKYGENTHMSDIPVLTFEMANPFQ